MDTITVRPKTETIGILLTARSQGISHHDPAMSDGSNVMLFRRMPRLVDMPQAEIDEGAVGTFYRDNPVPTELAVIMHEFTFAQFAATAFVRLFLDSHNQPDGIGHFENANKFQALQRRVAQAGVKSNTFNRAWDNLCKSMGCKYVASDGLLQFMALPPTLAYAAMAVLADESNSIVEIARFWHTRQKQTNAAYAEKSGEVRAELVEIRPIGKRSEKTGSMVIQVPALSGNSVRHQFREAAWRHMAGVLGIHEYQIPGHGELPPMVEALFINGGNIEQGSKAPANAPTIAAQIRQKYPVIDAFSGTALAFWLGKSALDVYNWLVCKENAESIDNPKVRELPRCSVSAFELLQDITETRKATPRGVGQMIQNFEVLCTGTQFYIELKFLPDTDDLTKGAVLCALDWFAENAPKVGGQSSRGYALVAVDVIAPLENADELKAQYESYLAENADVLRAGLFDGTMATEYQVLV